MGWPHKGDSENVDSHVLVSPRRRRRTDGREGRVLTATFSHSVTFKTQHASPVTCKIQPAVRSSRPKGVSSVFAPFAYTWDGKVLFSFE